jgi:hypothetical protein
MCILLVFYSILSLLMHGTINLKKIHILLRNKLPFPIGRAAGQRFCPVANLTSDVKPVTHPGRPLSWEQPARHITTTRRCYVTKHTTSSAVMNDHIIYHGENYTFTTWCPCLSSDHIPRRRNISFLHYRSSVSSGVLRHAAITWHFDVWLGEREIVVHTSPTAL